jgi:3-deoxy-D-manno-octulosonic-acid transferase
LIITLMNCRAVAMPRTIYSSIYYLLMPLILLRLLWRSIAVPAYRHRIAERFGLARCEPDRHTIWVHAVSVGEALAAVPVIEQLLQHYPAYRMVVTTTTPTGSERIQTLFGGRVHHVYMPYDLPGSVKRFLTATTPCLLVIMETELWPNMLYYANRVGCTTLLANARMSARSAAGYQHVLSLTESMMSQINWIAAQSISDASRFFKMGLSETKLLVTGSIKFDVNVSDQQRDKVAILRQSWCSDHRPVIVAASTHAGEDELILAAFKQLKTTFTNALLVLVPRHPERFYSVLTLCQQDQWSILQRSKGVEPGESVDILLGDTMGELPIFLGAGSIAFIGGSLVPHGGHNMLEASAWGVPVLTGPYVFNFAEISHMLERAGALEFVGDSDDLANSLLTLLNDKKQWQSMSAAGLSIVDANRGATQKLLHLIDQQLVR